MPFQKVTTNFTGLVRNDTMEGRDYLVVPMIMITEGVHAGSNGPLFYPSEELSKTPAAWNHKPVVVYHPQSNGEAVSACDPDILSNRKVGIIMNTNIGKVDVKINKKKVKITALKAEAWLEKDRMEKVDERIAEAVENNKMMELSTGVYTDNEQEEGDWNGEHYDAVARNYRPDHLALLPDLVGACSIEDGAGFLRLNEAKDALVIDMVTLADGAKDFISANRDGVVERMGRKLIAMVDNEMGHSNLRNLLGALLRSEKKDVFIEEVYDDFFIYEEKAVLYKQGYKAESGSVSFVGNREEVVKVIEYRSKAGIFVGNNHKKSNFSRKEKKMNKEKFVDELIKNESTLWTDEDKDILMELEEKILEKMTPTKNEDSEMTEVAKAAEKGAEDVVAPSDAEEKTENESNDEEQVENMTAEEYINKRVPVELKGVLRSGLASYNATKDRLVEVVTSNEKNTFTKEQLQNKDLDELKSLAALAVHTDEQKEKMETLNYAGQGDPAHNEAEEEPMDVPALNFEEK